MLMPTCFHLKQLFQFHKGTIRTDVGGPPPAGVFQFQFHKGTIRTIRQIKQRSSFQYFNSIKVRLEHKLSSIEMLPNCNFNSIKVRLEHSTRLITSTYKANFNSIKVRLEQKAAAKAIIFKIHISIP